MPEPSNDMSRRTLARGAAWAAPTIAVGAAAPAYAASPCACAPTLACPVPAAALTFGGALNQNGWLVTVQGSFSGSAVEYQSSWSPATGPNAACNPGVDPGGGGGSLANAVIGQGDPGASGASITYAKSLCLEAGRSYTATFTYATYAINNRAQTLTAEVLDCSGARIGTAATITAPARSRNTQGVGTFTFAGSPSRRHTFRYTWTFPTTPTSYTGCDRFANDIGVTAPTITC